MNQNKVMRKTKTNNAKGEIINFYKIIPKKYIEEVENPNYALHNIELPFRMCIVAPSGSGKTNFLLNLIRVFSQGKGTFTEIYIITRIKDEPLYNYLSGEFDQIYIKEGMSSTPKLDDMDKSENHLVIWDDLVLSKNLDSVEEYYIRARKKNCSVVFLSQTYYKIPQTIRLNSNYLVILHLGGSKRSTTAILNEWSQDLEKEQLKAVYSDATKENMRPLIITGGKVDRNKKYRKGFLDYYNLDEFLKNLPVDLIDKKLLKPKGKKRNKNPDYDSEESPSDSEI